MAVAASVIINMEANIARLVTDMNKVKKSLDSVSKSADSLKKAVSTISFAAIVNLAQQAMNATNRIIEFGRSVASSANDLQRQADIVGMSTSEFQQWNYVAKMADIETQSLMFGFRTLAKNISDAGDGTGQAAIVFSKLGISVKNTDGSLKSINQVITELARTFPQLGGDTEQLAAAMDLVGSRSGAAFTQLFKLGGEGISKLIQQFKDMGFEIDESWIKRLSESENAFKQLGFAGAKLKASLVPIIEEIADLTARVAQNTMLWMKEYETNQMNIAVKELYDLKVQLRDTNEELSKMKSDGPTLAQRLFGTYEGNVRYLEETATKLEKKIKDIQKSWETPAKTETTKVVDDRMAKEMAYAKEGAANAKLYHQAWIESLTEIDEAMSKLGQVSQSVLTNQAQNAVKNLETIKQAFLNGKTGIVDYVNALKGANEALKKLTGDDYWKEKLDAETEYQEKSKEINKDEEGWQKKQNKLIDEYFSKMKEIAKKEIPVHADVSPLESEINASIAKLQAKGITIRATIEGEGAGVSGSGAGGSPTTLSEWKSAISGGFGNAASGALQDLTDIESKLKGISDINVDIGIYGTGSSRKPITEKIQEIITEFGGLDKALAGMEAEINLAELTVEYNTLSKQLEKIQRVLPDLSNALGASSWYGAMGVGPGTAYMQQITGATEELKSKMSIIQLKKQYEILKGYGGSMQSGGIVPRTGLYKLHEGERVTSRSVTMGNININLPSGTSKEQAKEIARQLALLIKYRRSGDLAEYV